MGERPTYTVHELAEVSGCTVRTLHHYDSIGLLCPQRQPNGYRAYGAAEVDRLQQVLLYRQMGMPLAQIKQVLDDPAFDAVAALREHLERLQAQQVELKDMIASVRKTLAAAKGDGVMPDEERFKAFKQAKVRENEQRYGKEARERWGDEAVDASNAKVMGMSEGQYRKTQELQQEMRESLLAAMEQGDSACPQALHAADLHRQWLCCFWKEGQYSRQAHRGMAQMYVDDPRFRANYEQWAPGAAEFLRDAINAYCQE